MRRVGTFALSVVLASSAMAMDDLESVLSGKTSEKAVAAEGSGGIVRALQMSLGSLGPAQMPFVRAMEKGEWADALIEYQGAIQGTAFQGSANEEALRGLLQFKAGLPLTGIESLFSVAKPEAIDREIVRQWMEQAPASHEAWEFARIAWTPAWSQVLSPELEIRIRSARTDGKQDIEGLRQLVLIAAEGSEARARIQWKLVIALSLNDQAEEAARLLAQLMKMKSPPVSQDLMNLTAARLLYQRAFFEAAAKYDEKIPKGSDLWTQAQEEMAWAYVRKGEPNNALAVTKSLVHPTFSGDVGAESFFLRSLAQLKVCDYDGVVKTLGDVSPRFKARTLTLDKLARETQGPAVEALMAGLRSGKARTSDLGPHLENLPRFIHRDERLRQLARAEVVIEQEASVAAKIYGRTLALTGLQSRFETLKQGLEARAKMARASSLARVREMAEREVKDTRQLLQKMHIVEAEVLQQVSIADKIAKASSSGAVREFKGTTGSNAKTALRFPAEKETWFDEIGNYRLDVRKGCQVVR